MDDIQSRLTEAGAACLSAYDAWAKAKNKDEAKEALEEAVHELRKVAARIEIDMSVSEREPKNSRRIPIPEHRASRKGGGKADDAEATDAEASNDDQAAKPARPRRRAAAGRKSAE